MDDPLSHIVLNTVERRLSGDGLTGGRLNRAHEFDSWCIVANIFYDD